MMKKHYADCGAFFPLHLLLLKILEDSIFFLSLRIVSPHPSERVYQKTPQKDPTSSPHWTNLKFITLLWSSFVQNVEPSARTLTRHQEIRGACIFVPRSIGLESTALLQPNQATYRPLPRSRGGGLSCCWNSKSEDATTHTAKAYCAAQAGLSHP